MIVNLNENALKRLAVALDFLAQLRINVAKCEDGARLIDCGVDVAGGLESGRLLAEVCLAGYGHVTFGAGDASIWPGPTVSIATDQPVAACMASQYAGWPIEGEDYFAMGSGPMRAARGREAIFDQIGFQEKPSSVIGVLESGKLPALQVCKKIAEECGVSPTDVTLLIAPTSSLAGTIQVVSRTVETALHKMHELEFDLARVQSGFGVAPLPPVAADDMAGIGRTNDAVMYGGEVTLWVTGDDASLEELGPQIPSCSSADYGEPFGRLFERYDRDFYKIDPLLFSPAVVNLVNLDTGKSFRFGQTRADVLRESFTN